MKALLLASLLLAQDDDEKRIELLKRVAPAMVGSEREGTSATVARYTLPLNLVTGSYKDALTDLSEAFELSPRYGEAYFVRGKALSTLGRSMSKGALLTGFFVDDKGTFVTTSSAKLGASGKVRLHDGRDVKATRLAREESLGLAILKIEGTASPLKLADSSKIVAGRTLHVASRTGDFTVLRSAVVVGREDALDAYVSVDPFLHLDYPALQSEMGSPVVDAAGDVVGILVMPVYEEDEPYGTKIHVPRRVYAIPSNTIKAYLDILQRRGKFERGYLGITMSEDGAGVRVAIVSGSPAVQGGLKEGDVIIGVDGAKVDTWEDLKRIVTFKAGEKIEIALKDGRKVTVTVGVREEETSAKDAASVLRDRVGIEVTYLSKDLRRYLDLPQNGEDRVVVTKALSGGPAEAAGLRKGDVLLAVDQQDINSESALAEQLQKSKKGSYSVFEVLSDGKKIKAIVTLR